MEENVKRSCGHFNGSIPLGGDEFTFIAMLEVRKDFWGHVDHCG